jgi:hypothetical protein
MQGCDFQRFDFRVRAGRIRITYLKDRKQLQSLRQVTERWRKSIGRHAGPEQSDAIEFAKAALQRWSSEYTQGRTSSSVKGIRDMKKYNPHTEVGVLAIASGEWLRRDPIVGICHFRCTWSGNLAIDYLVSHPTLRNSEEDPIAGLGSGFLGHICDVAGAIDADAVWGETTPNSVAFYRGLLGEAVLKDLVILQKNKYLAFVEQLAKLAKT